MKILILSLGNPLRGDDGIGAEVVTALGDLPPDVDAVDGGTAGLDIVLLFEGYERVIIIDAAEMGLPAGEWQTFSVAEVTRSIDENNLTGTLHSAGLPEALVLARALDLLPQDVTIYGIQPASVGWIPSLTRPLEKVVASIADTIRREVC